MLVSYNSMVLEISEKWSKYYIKRGMDLGMAQLNGLFGYQIKFLMLVFFLFR